MSAAKNAAQSEATNEATSVEFKGVTYLVPPALDLPVEILEADNELGVLKEILGEEQYRAFRASKPTLRDLRELGDRVSDAAGFDSLGNSG